MGDCICVRRGDGPEGCGICNETGTTPDIAGLCERLRKPLDYTLHLYQCDVDTTMANAADTLERQAAEIKRLREALGLASRRFYVFRDMTDHTSDRVCLATWADEARAALTGEDT
jgi:hypothetical protein